MFRSHLPDTFHDRNVCILGLGYVRLTLAVVMAEVASVSKASRSVKRLARTSRGSSLLRAALAGRLMRVVDPADFGVAARPEGSEASVYVITVGTPLDAEHKVRVEHDVNVAREVPENLESGDMVVIHSTVELGTTRDVVKPVLDATDLTTISCLSRAHTGGPSAPRAARAAASVGGLDRDARIRAAQVFQFLTPTVVPVSSLETAELIEFVDNAQRDVFFGLSNEVARIADAIGVSVVEVVRTGKLGYARTDLAMPGPVGGPCLEKDSLILANRLTEVRFSPEIIMAARRRMSANPMRSSHGSNVLSRDGPIPDFPVITLAGFAFKGRPETDDLRGTMAKPILAALRAAFPFARFRWLRHYGRGGGRFGRFSRSSRSRPLMKRLQRELVVIATIILALRARLRWPSAWRGQESYSISGTILPPVTSITAEIAYSAWVELAGCRKNGQTIHETARELRSGFSSPARRNSLAVTS